LLLKIVYIYEHCFNYRFYNRLYLFIIRIMIMYVWMVNKIWYIHNELLNFHNLYLEYKFKQWYILYIILWVINTPWVGQIFIYVFTMNRFVSTWSVLNYCFSNPWSVHKWLSILYRMLITVVLRSYTSTTILL